MLLLTLLLFLSLLLRELYAFNWQYYKYYENFFCSICYNSTHLLEGAFHSSFCDVTYPAQGHRGCGARGRVRPWTGHQSIIEQAHTKRQMHLHSHLLHVQRKTLMSPNLEAADSQMDHLKESPQRQTRKTPPLNHDG